MSSSPYSLTKNLDMALSWTTEVHLAQIRRPMGDSNSKLRVSRLQSLCSFRLLGPRASILTAQFSLLVDSRARLGVKENYREVMYEVPHPLLVLSLGLIDCNPTNPSGYVR